MHKYFVLTRTFQGHENYLFGFFFNELNEDNELLFYLIHRAKDFPNPWVRNFRLLRCNKVKLESCLI